jgi:hypothetical protein
MQKNVHQTPQINNTKLFEDAAKKLQKIEKDRKQAEKYFKERENNENKLKLMESNIKKKVKQEKRASMGLEEKTVEKLQILLKTLSIVDLSILNKIDDKGLEKETKQTQTDKEETAALMEKLNNLEKETDKNLAKKSEYKKQIALMKSEIETLKEFNEKLTKENKLLTQNLDETNKLKKEAETKFKDLQSQNQILSDNLSKNTKMLKEYIELKATMEEKIKMEQESMDLEEIEREKAMKELKGNFKILVHFNLMHNVTEFLHPKDFNNLKLTCKQIHDSLDNNINSTKHFYRSLVSSFKLKLKEFENVDFKKEYIISDTEMEKLLRE